VTDKREAKREYKLSHRPMGVFEIRNLVNGKLFLDSSLNIPAKINRHKFQLEAGVHPSNNLQADWNELGESAFEFDTLEPVEPRDSGDYDYTGDLSVLEDLWLEKLQPYGEMGYNEPKKTREERLRMIADNRRKAMI